MTEEPNRFLDLNIDDLAPLGGIVRLGERDYALRSPDGLNLTEISQLQQYEKRFLRATRLMQTKADDPKTAAESEANLDGLIHLILPTMPAEELAKLGYIKKTKVYAFFAGRLAEFQQALEAAMQPTSLSTTPTSSPD